MKMERIAGRLARIMLLVLTVASAGCARPSYQNLKLTAPAVASSETLRTQSVMIRNVTDERDLDAQTMREPPQGRSTHVMAREIGDVPPSAATPDGRVTLPSGAKVEDLIRQTLRNTFEALGYHIETDPGNLSSADILVDVKIQKFWAWTAARGLTMPGSEKSFMNGSIAATLDLKGPMGKKTSFEIASDYRRGVVLVPTPAQLMEVYKTLLEDFASNAKSSFSNLPQP